MARNWAELPSNMSLRKRSVCVRGHVLCVVVVGQRHACELGAARVREVLRFLLSAKRHERPAQALFAFRRVFKFKQKLPHDDVYFVT